MKTLDIITPDDWHCHLRDGKALCRTVPDQARSFRRSLVMPNLIDPLVSVSQVTAYRERILAQVPVNRQFNPLFVLYLNQQVTTDELVRAKGCDYLYGCKLYPAGVTTGSQAGVKMIDSIYPLLAMMEELDLILLVHGEVNDPTVDVFDRERVFIERHMLDIMARFPRLRVILEHITTKDAVDFVTSGPSTLAATITAHHLLLNRNALFEGGLQPDHYCLPLLKRASHQQALIQAAISGHPRFFLGTDSAPHTIDNKHKSCGCAGIYSSPVALACYAEVFEQYDALDKLEGFASRHGPTFYGLPINTQTITLSKASWRVPCSMPFSLKGVTPFRANDVLPWRVEHDILVPDLS